MTRVKPPQAGTTQRATLKRLYQMSIEDLNAIWQAQGGRCATCQRQFGPSRGFNVDHDHACCPSTPTCGQCTRGLLCQRCNHQLLGTFGDDPGFYARVAYYLSAPPYPATKKQCSKCGEDHSPMPPWACTYDR